MYVSRFDVQRWLHPKLGDGRTRLILTPNQLPGYVFKRKKGNFEIFLCD